MRRTPWILAAGLAVAVAAPALAGGKGEKCSQDAQACLNHMAAKKAKGWMGLELDKTAEGQQSVKKVVDGTPAAAAGFMVGDVLIQRNGISVSDYEALKADKASWNVGSKVTYTIRRADAEKQLVVTLAAMPEEVFASMVGAHMVNDHMGVTATATAETEKVEKPAIKAASSQKK